MADTKGDRAAAREAPLLSLSSVPVVYFDNLEPIDVIGGNLRLILWRWTRVGGLLVREPVIEAVRPESATVSIRKAIDRAVNPASFKLAAVH